MAAVHEAGRRTWKAAELENAFNAVFKRTGVVLNFTPCRFKGQACDVTICMGWRHSTADNKNSRGFLKEIKKWLDRWIISCWCTCSMKASVFYTSLCCFGGFFLPAAHEFLMNAGRKNTHGNAKKHKMKRRREERRRRVQTDTPCAKYFRSWKAERGRKRRRSHIIPGNTRHGAMKVFVHFTCDRFLSRSSFESWTPLIGRDMSLRLKDFSRRLAGSRLGDNFNQVAYIFLQATHIKKTRE